MVPFVGCLMPLSYGKSNLFNLSLLRLAIFFDKLEATFVKIGHSHTIVRLDAMERCKPKAKQTTMAGNQDEKR